jgi:hypothetical protein
LFPAFIHAQNYPAFPERKALAGREGSKPLQERSDYEYYNQPVVANFHPIGWSADGKAAYLCWSEGLKKAQMGVIVYDAVKDTIAGKWFDDFGDENRLLAGQVVVLWGRDKDSIFPLLKKFNIVADTNTLYRDYPFTVSINKKSCNFTMEYSMHNAIDNPVIEDTIYMKSMIQCDNKTEAEKIKAGGFRSSNIFPSGVWMSPDKKYALVAIVSDNGEQLPHVMTFQFKAIKLPD